MFDFPRIWNRATVLTFYSRPLLSQDRHEVYITLGEDDGEYQEYLRDGKTGPYAFLNMQQHGPWDLTNKAHVQEFCQAAVALTMIASDAAET